ncbi:MAG: hypothetical protein CL912_21135 [Deltaproteobacteria bacterium]|nr:hypothetical protein [Deltaproteobacteria bacterium]
MELTRISTLRPAKGDGIADCIMQSATWILSRVSGIEERRSQTSDSRSIPEPAVLARLLIGVSLLQSSHRPPRKGSTAPM